MFTTPDSPAELGGLFEELSPRFVVQRSLSVGRYKRVILARDTLIDREVAVSVIEAPLGIEMRDTALKEIRGAALLGQKPNIATIYDVIETPQRLLVVCEFLPGGTLEELLDRYDLRRLPLDKTLRVATQVCNALGYVHDEGIVHRDLKASNLMFDDAGIVHLVDFGTSGVAHEFALDDDQCSFGSPAYMSPEQIRGEPADIRTDLYALGCVIYEMLVGSAPFTGTSEQTITGHLTRTPDSIQSFREEAPRSVTDLVRTLLAKNKADRPSNVDDVRRILEGSLERITRHHVTQKRPARFVGRDEELERINSAFKDAGIGLPSVLLVEGPPGIGKSRLLDVALETARAASMNTLVGQCSIDNDNPLACLRNAFAPVWVQPQGAAFSGDVQSTQRHSVEEREQWIIQLIDELITYSEEHGPLVLAIDNLHWANQLTLTVANFLIHRIKSRLHKSRPRLVLLLAARPTAPSTMPLLDEIRDQTSLLRPEGLAEDHIRAWVEDCADARPTRPFLTLLTHVTGGNPLFLGEVFRMLEARGDITVDGGRVDLRERSSEIDLPVTPLDAFRDSFQRLSSNSRRVLMVASFLGERFDVTTLAGVVSLSVSGIKELLAEALSIGLLNIDTNGYVFRHALARQAIYGTPGTHRREMMHAQIVDRLERLPNADRDESMLAHHYVRAGTRVDAIRTMRYAEHAGDQSQTIYDFEGAARYYEAAATAAERSPNVALEQQAQLHFKTAYAFARGYDLRVSTHHYRIAAQLYEQAGNHIGRVRALNDIVRNEFSSGEIAPGQLAHVDELEAGLRNVGELALRAEVLDTLASAYVHAQSYVKAAEASADALAIASQLNDQELLAHLHGSVGALHNDDLRLVEALEAWRAVQEHGTRAGSDVYIARGLQRQPLPLLLLGRLDEANEIIKLASTASQATNNVGESSFVFLAGVIASTLKGEFDAANEAGRKALEIIESTRYPWAAPALIPALASARAASGNVEGALSVLRVLDTETRIFDDPSPYQSTTSRLRKLLEAMRNPSDELRAELLCSKVHCSTDRVTLHGVSRACVYVELASWLQLPELAAECYGYLLAAQKRGLVVTSGWVFLMPRLIGVAATLREDYQAADPALSDAIRFAERNQAWPELARALFDRARLLRLVAADHQAWRDDLLRAQGMFRQLRMPLDLARAERFHSQLA